MDGLVEPGNIDLYKRPLVKNPDGTTSTVRSITAEFDGKHVVLPTVHPEGRIMSDEEAKQRYRDTGEHLGVFSDPQAANTYAQQLHQEQERYYGLGGQLDE